jgi:hypothetical protein
VTDIATALSIGRGSVYRALEAVGPKAPIDSKKVRGVVAEVEKSLRQI